MMNDGRRGRPYELPEKYSCVSSDEPERVRARPQPPSLLPEFILGLLSPTFGRLSGGPGQPGGTFGA